MTEETEIKRGGWVRMPKEFGYAEGQIVETVGHPMHIFGEPTAAVYFPQRGEALVCPKKWLLPIEEPSNYPDAPIWNPSAEGHPMVERVREQADLVTAYARSIERGLTEVTCWCPWTPMEVEGRMGRLRSGEHPQCPVHTKEGFLFGFIDFVRDRFARDERNVNKIVAAFDVPAPDEGSLRNIEGNAYLEDPDEQPVIETMETKQAGARFL